MVDFPASGLKNGQFISFYGREAEMFSRRGKPFRSGLGPNSERICLYRKSVNRSPRGRTAGKRADFPAVGCFARCSAGKRADFPAVRCFAMCSAGKRADFPAWRCFARCSAGKRDDFPAGRCFVRCSTGKRADFPAERVGRASDECWGREKGFLTCRCAAPRACALHFCVKMLKFAAVI